MKKTNLRRLLPILLTVLTLLVCTFGITAAAETDEAPVRSGQIKYANLVLDNNVDFVFYVDISEESAESNETFITFNDGKRLSYSGMKAIGDVQYAVYKLKNIMPEDLDAEVVAKMYVSKSLTSVATYSPKEYCQKLLNDAKSSDSLKALVSDLLCYADEAQELAGQDEALITDGITGLVPSAEPTKLAVAYETMMTNRLDSPTAFASSSKLVMTDGVKIYFNVDLPDDADPSEYTACLSVNGREQEVRIVPDGYYYRAIFSGVYIHELFDNIQLNIYKGSRRVSDSMNFSIVTYLNSLKSTEKYSDIALAYYNYAYSAHLYTEGHKASIPGNVVSDNNGNILYDPSGSVKYTCVVCGSEIEEMTVTNIRDFEDACNGGDITTADSNGNELFTVTTATEKVAGNTNSYLSFIRDTTKNKGTDATSYYIKPAHTRTNVIGDFIDSNGSYKGTTFTFSVDVKAPSNGVAETSVYLRNSKTTSSGRYFEMFTIGTSGELTRNSINLAGDDTVNASEWSKITVTVEFVYTKEGSMILLDYYLNGLLFSTQLTSNTLYVDKFTDIYIATGAEGTTDGQGIFLDNIYLIQGAIRSYTGSIDDYADRIARGELRKLVDMVNNNFDIEDFSYVVRWDKGTEFVYTEKQGFVTFPAGTYIDPLETPKRYDHPRLLFNTSDIPSIVDNLEKDGNERVYNTFIERVRRNETGVLAPTDKTITHVTHPNKFENTNYSTSSLSTIEAKALYYALYKNDTRPEYSDAKLRGYQAIYAIKNYILTFDVQWDYSDQCRMYGEVMYYAALVYDWCYDLLTEDDMDQLRLGVQNLLCDGTSNAPWLGQTHDGRKLEGGFPALAVEHQSPLTGHGAEAQVLRDYFSFAIAIFDEDPSWYDYVGGMIYQDYVPARNYFYTSNYFPDGSAGYNCYRFLCDLHNAWLFKGMGVELPYNEEDMASVIHGLMSLETVNGFLFATADGSGTSSSGNYRFTRYIGDAALISSYLFNDDTALAISDYINGSFSTNTSQLCTTIARYVILTANDLEPSEDYQELIDNVEYHQAYAQQVVSRSGKDENDPIVFMQGAQHLPGGHTHQNAGSFQIWYKGMLTRDDGLYDAYGSDHHFYYHMSGTAHNTLLIYNPEYANANIGPNANSIGYYNGAQRYHIGVSGTLEPWLENNAFSFGSLIGMRTDDETNPSFVYFANDITNAYDSSTVDYVERSIMTLYTGDEETPMVMFIFDNITADSEDFQKSFLLQCVDAPVIGVDGQNNKTVTVSNGDGQMVLTSLTGADDIKAYGRTSLDGVVLTEEDFRIKDSSGNYVVDENGNYVHNEKYMAERFYLSGAGKNLPAGGATSIGDKSSDLNVVWGHVEVRPNTGNKTDRLVNVIYVSDAGTTVTATPTLIEGTYLTGATFKNHTTMFVNDPMFSSNELSFTTTGDGEMTYYIGGLTEGTWKVTINGKEIGEFKTYDVMENEDGSTVAKEDYTSRMISFTGEVGEVVLTPSEDMRPAGSVLIYYYLDGGKLPEGTLNYYMVGEGLLLPTPKKSGSTFAGWFLDEDFTKPITEISKTANTTFKLYAKWNTPILDVDYTQGGSVSNYGQITHAGGTGGGRFSIVEDKTNYLLWQTTGVNSLITKDGAYSEHAKTSLQLSFTLTLGANGYDPIIPFDIYLRDSNVGQGENNRYISVLKVDASGKVYIGNSTAPGNAFAQITNAGMTTIRFVLDFDKGRVYMYDNDGKIIKDLGLPDINVSIPRSGDSNLYDSYADWFRNLKSSSSSIITLKSMGAGSLRIARISVNSGNVTDNCRNFDNTSEMHTWDDGEVITAPSKFNCTPGIMKYTCTECEITKEVPIPAEKTHNNITHSYVDSILTYKCNQCGCTFEVDTGYYLDGSSHLGIVGYGNATNYTTAIGTHLPEIEGGSYKLLNKTGKRADLELWVPAMGSALAGFSTNSYANGFISFKINAHTEESINFHFVDVSSDAAKWSSEWCITESFFTVSAPTEVDGKTVIKLVGWDEWTLKTIEGTGFTDWVDVKIYISLDPTSDKITLLYFIDGVYVTSCSKTMSIKTNSINAVCISGTTSATDSGLYLDDIGFGYTANGIWIPSEEN